LLRGGEGLILSLSTTLPVVPPLTEDAAWQLLLGLARDTDGQRATGIDGPDGDIPSDFLALYRPLCEPARHGTRVLAHLGQSIDGYIATATGDSSYVNDQENIRHLHRLRALHDAVIVGARTIAADNPRLTTRLVPGPSPSRVVLDPQLRLPATARVFSDDAAATFVVVAEGASRATRHGSARIIYVPARDGRLDLAQVSARLAAHGLRKLFIEGGGTTVSHYFDAGLLDRLQIAIAPVLIGRGQPGLRLAPNHSMQDCPRLPRRIFAMGQDLLFDCDLRARTQPDALAPPTSAQADRTDQTAAIRRVS
jgi:riboflavin-specific deaminase-like protein